MRSGRVVCLAFSLGLLWSPSLAASNMGRVLVRSATTGARVFVDGREVGEIPMRLPLVLKPGRHTIKVSKPGHADFLDAFRVRKRRDTILEIDLLPTAGVLRVTSDVEGAVVIVDGRQIGDVPFDGEVEPGARVVEVRARGYLPFRREMEMQAGVLYPLEVALVPVPAAPPAVVAEPPWYGRWYVWAGAAAAVAGGVTAVVLLSRDDGAPPEPGHVLRLEPIR